MGCSLCVGTGVWRCLRVARRAALFIFLLTTILSQFIFPPLKVMTIDQSKIDAFKHESGAIVTIQELLRGRDADFDAAKTVRLVRHAICAGLPPTHSKA